MFELLFSALLQILLLSDPSTEPASLSAEAPTEVTNTTTTTTTTTTAPDTSYGGGGNWDDKN